ncbi:MAG: Flavin-Reduct domain-containing protein [Lachnoclostridium sp.]|jgi:flavin reductase (DIM6/NTAB) family NADH-FMN oxidoreductase RutF
MNHFKEIPILKLEGNPFHMIGDEWMLITAEKEGKVNTMTASWGGFGILWDKKVAYTVIRPQRYTKEFVDFADNFSLSFYDNSYKKTLGYLGTVSGRDEDKIAKSGLTVAYDNGIPYFAEAKTVLFCKKLFAQPFDPDNFIDTSIPGKCYPEKDYHTLYISEIQKVLIKE